MSNIAEQKEMITIEEINRLTDLALRGNADAQNELAVYYYEGNGVEQNYATAEYWLSLAAEQGYALAQYNLGEYYYEKQNLSEAEYEECCRKAFHWFREAANQGNADAMFRLGICYGLSIGVDWDSEKASEWYRKSAELGNAHAQCEVDGWWIRNSMLKSIVKNDATKHSPYETYSLKR